MAAKKAKLVQQFMAGAAQETTEENREGIFKGIAIFVNGYTVPSADELKRIMMVHGGIYHQYFHSSKTTHIIASNLPDSKVKMLRGQKIVKPNWVVDSVNAGKLLDFRQYLLYSNQSRLQPQLNFEVVPKDNSEILEHASDASESKSTESSLEDIKLENEQIGNEDDKNECDQLFESVAKDLKSVGSAHSVAGPLNETSASNLSKTRSSHTAGRAGEPNFISEFYNHSRLHHISTMGALFKRYVTELQEKSDKTFPGRRTFKEWKLSNTTNCPDADNDEEGFNKSLDHDRNKSDSCTKSKVIMHIDMDCFFVSVGLRNCPELRGVPVAVTHGKGNSQKHRPGVDREFEFNYYRNRVKGKVKNNKEEEVDDGFIDEEPNLQSHNDAEGQGTVEKERFWRLEGIEETSSMSEIASCSYEARKAGIKNGMFLGAALKLCPNLKTIPYDFEGYKEVSFMLYDTVASYTLNIEAVSCDEMYVDCTDILRESRATPLEFASFLRNQIKQKTGCPASTGFGSSPLLARLATKKAKPDGQFYLEQSAVQDFMKNISIEDIPGVGYSLSYRLKNMGAVTCGHLQSIPLSSLQKEFGPKTGLSLYRHCRGEDSRQLNVEHCRKSVSAEVNYGIRFTSQDEANNFLKELAGEVQNRLEEINVKGRCITLKLMVRTKEAPVETAKFMGHGVCDHITRSTTLGGAVSDSAIIAREVLSLLRQLAVKPSDLRGIGIQVSRLEKGKSGGLENFLLRGKNLNDARKESCEERKNDNAKAQLPHITELDAEVLAALPEDIKEEVLKEYRQGGNPRSSNVDELAVPGTSGLQNSSCVKVSSVRSVPDDSTGSSGSLSAAAKSLDSVPALGTEEESLSFSQIDPSFLAALPEDMREELKIELEERKKAASAPTGNHLISSPSRVLADKSGHPKKKSSPKGKGCTRIKSSKQLDKGQQTLQKFNAAPTGDSVTHSYAAKPDVKHVEKENKEIPDGSGSILGENLSLNEVRQLIKEWVARETLPQVVDIQMMAEYMQELVMKRQLDTLDLVVKCLYRCINQKQKKPWQQAYNTIINQVQDVMLIVYKAKLKVQDKFVGDSSVL